MCNIKLIGFDADDTLWQNETYFQETEREFCTLLGDFLTDEKTISNELYKTEMLNLPYYGYGIKGFTLSMIETMIRVSKGKSDTKHIEKVIQLGKELLNKPVELLEGVNEVLALLNKEYPLIVATKGDLFNQENKLKKSGIDHYFHHIEIMSDKKENNYKKMLDRLNCIPENFVMIGNSIKSDILPVLNLGGFAIHIPFHVTWSHENTDKTIDHPNFIQINNISALPDLLKSKFR